MYNDYIDELARQRGVSPTQLRMRAATPDSLMRDIVSDQRRGPARPASIADKPNAEPQRDSRPQGNGWVDAPALPSAPRGDKIIERLIAAQDAKDRAERGR